MPVPGEFRRAFALTVVPTLANVALVAGNFFTVLGALAAG